jgi:TIGR03009 family protein
MTLGAVLFVALSVRAQPPAGTPGVPPVVPAPPGVPPTPVAAPSAAPTDPRLDAHLDGWQKTMTGVINFSAKFELKRTDAVFKKDRQYTGMVLCMKPNFARLRIDNTADKNDYEAYICNGKAVYEYNGREKTITEFKLNAGAGADNLMLDFLGGMNAGAVKRRFHITLFKEDANYVYLDIKPLYGKDKQEFEQVRFALYGPNVKLPFTAYMPAQVWLMKPNGDTELWKFSDQQTRIPGVDAKVFDPVQIKGWSFKQAPMGPAPAPGGPPTLPGGTGLPSGPGAVKPR